MYVIDQEEIDAVAAVLRAKALFRYGIGNQCDRFEARYANYLGVRHFALAASGSNALVAAMAALGLGPGDEVLIPAHTYMATATSVVSVGAIPVIVDIDDSLTLDPLALEDAIGPRTRAVVPVHMWGTACAMNEIMEVARRRGLLVIEDACQGVGGGYEGRKFGSIGDAGCFSFNYYKNMSSGEGGGVAINADDIAERVRCSIDPCHFYWQGRSDGVKPFVANGARATEITGALLNVQLDRLDGMVQAMRSERDAILARTQSLGNLGLNPARLNGRSEDCGTYVFYTLPSAEDAERFTSLFPSVVAGKTGRHNYTEWDQVLMGEGAAHPALNPFNMPENAECRRTYSRDMCTRSLEILNRTVLVPTHPLHGPSEIDDIVHNINMAAHVALGGLSRDDANFRTTAPLEVQKYDLSSQN
jgi:dTDP-4-amino-4,6-dideoxygalactose transaminase